MTNQSSFLKSTTVPYLTYQLIGVDCVRNDVQKNSIFFIFYQRAKKGSLHTLGTGVDYLFPASLILPEARNFSIMSNCRAAQQKNED